VGAVLVTVEISHAGAAELVRLGWLMPENAGRPLAIADALLALGSEAIARGLQPPRARAREGVGEGSVSPSDTPCDVSVARKNTNAI